MAWHRRFRHYVGQRRHEEKLAHLLQSTRFGTARDVLEQMNSWPSSPARATS
jgi:hypothetical protein